MKALLSVVLVVAIPCFADEKPKASPASDPESILASQTDAKEKVTTFRHKDQPASATGIHMTLDEKSGDPSLKTKLTFVVRSEKGINLKRCEVWVNEKKYDVSPNSPIDRSSKSGETTESFTAPASGRNVVLLMLLADSPKKATMCFHGDDGVVDHELSAEELRWIHEVHKARTAMIDRRDKAGRVARPD